MSRRGRIEVILVQDTAVGMQNRAQEPEISDPIAFGPYLLRQRIAVGGFAEVFLADTVASPSAPPLVVKRLLPSLRARGDVDILEREAELHRLVRHPNVVKVVDAGTVEGEPYIAMEYVDGLDLHRLLQRSSSSHQAIPPTLAVHIGRNLADALGAVHTAKHKQGDGPAMIHGDVSPSNIYLGTDGSVKLGDFGIARLATQRQVDDEPVRAAGHFGYLAPEQLTGEAQDQRVDVFALGAVLGELLHGSRVFPGSGQLAVMLSIRDANIAPLRAIAAKLPRGLFEVCERALMRDPSDRYASAQEFSAALRPFEQPSTEALRHSLSSWVMWAKDKSKFAQDLEQRVRESVNMMKAVSKSNSGVKALRDLGDKTERSAFDPAAAKLGVSDTEPPSSAEPIALGRPAGSPAGPNPLVRTSENSQVRRTGSGEIESVPFSKLLEMVATGELKLTDEVALWGAPFQPVEKIEELARHLLPSTTQTTSRMFGPGLPDFIADFSEVPMLEVLAKIHNEKRTCTLFVTQSRRYREQRKDVYIRDGRLLHVTSTDPDELLGHYLVHHNVLTEEQLEQALAQLGRGKKQLGEILIGLGLVDAVDIFTALRNQGRDRIAALCGWKRGSAQLYAGAAPERMLFPLDLDLTLCMMAGALRNGLAPPDARIFPGPRAPAVGDKSTSVPLLNLVPMVARKRMTTAQALMELVPLGKRKSDEEAKAALVVAEALDWIAYE
jgi:serine/threonine-protein kinase